MIEACTAASSYCLLGIPADLTHRILSLHLQLVELFLMLRKPNILCQEMFTFPTHHLLLIHIDRITRMLLECLPCLNLYWSKPWSAIAQSHFGSFSSLTHGCAFPVDLPTGNVHGWQCGGLIVTVYMHYMVTIISMTLRVWLCPIISLDYCCTILRTQCLLFGVYCSLIELQWSKCDRSLPSSTTLTHGCAFPVDLPTGNTHRCSNIWVAVGFCLGSV